MATPDSRIRPIEPADLRAVAELVYELAEYERLRSECHLTTAQLDSALFGPAPALYGLVACNAGDVVGYALYFLNFSTWEGVHGIYLEDLYVRPDQRGSGLGRGLLLALAGIARDNGYARVEWSVLDWNAPSIAFYQSMGAVPMSGWSVYRLTGPALLAAASTEHTAIPKTATPKKEVESG
ncbi:MAG: GNAT family N-acetyltransferase [Nakamurella sp.]